MHILLAEDEVSLAKALAQIFRKNNFTVDVVYNGRDALDYLRSNIYDCAVLDIMMPAMDGITVLRQLRESGNMTPILFLTAKSETEDIVLGLDSGANDYLTKPFDSAELLARIRAMTRSRNSAGSMLKLGNTCLDRATFELHTPHESFRLPNKEFRLAEMLLSNPNTIISVDQFFEKIWGYDCDTDLNTVWVYISYLRKKLAQGGSDLNIRVVRNAGDIIEVQP